jgi:hypothetical protein
MMAGGKPSSIPVLLILSPANAQKCHCKPFIPCADFQKVAQIYAFGLIQGLFFS